LFLIASLILLSDAAHAQTHPDWARKLVTYEVNVRQYTPKGTFAAFETHLDRLQELGTGILWLMPVHPIGRQNRPGTPGSYYSVRD
jgi:1,4-alpha-glucan branching enzyme